MCEVPGDLYRVLARIERGRGIRFTVQYEAWIEGRAYPVVRYDSAHGRAHCDTLDWTGRVVNKKWLDIASLDEAMTDAVDTIKADRRVFREEFVRRRP